MSGVQSPDRAREAQGRFKNSEGASRRVINVARTNRMVLKAQEKRSSRGSSGAVDPPLELTENHQDHLI